MTTYLLNGYLTEPVKSIPVGRPVGIIGGLLNMVAIGVIDDYTPWMAQNGVVGVTIVEANPDASIERRFLVEELGSRFNVSVGQRPIVKIDNIRYLPNVDYSTKL